MNQSMQNQAHTFAWHARPTQPSPSAAGGGTVPAAMLSFNTFTTKNNPSSVIASCVYYHCPHRQKTTVLQSVLVLSPFDS